jgi:hypothetical protein
VNPRTTGILLGVALALGAFVHFYVIEGEEGRQEAEERSKRLFEDVEAKDVVWLTVTTNDGAVVRAERGDTGWRIVEPVEFPGDAFALDALASAAAEATSGAVYEEPQPLEVYGLQEGAPEVRFVAGAEEHALRTGKRTPLGGNTYALVVGEEAVHAIEAFQANALDKSFDDLREKKILDFDPEGARRIVASWPDGRVELVRDGESWNVAAPIEGPADAKAVRGLLSDLEFLRATGFEDEPASDAELGLDRPAFAVELELVAAEEGGEPRQIALAIGSGVDGEDRFVRGAWPSLYRVPSGRLGDFTREVVHYRFKELASYAAADAQRVELRFQEPGEDEVVIVAERGEGGWTSTPEAMVPGKISRLVLELSHLVADDILAERVGPDERAGLELDPANVTFVVSGAGDADEARLAEVRLGKIRSGGGVVAQTGENPQIFELPIELGEHIPLNHLGFRNHFLAPPPDPEPAPMSEELPPLE